MMAEYEFIFASNLKTKLIEKVKGGVKTWITNDELHVSILVRENDIQFEHVIPNISKLILNNYTSDYAAYQVMQVYKSYIRNKFFK